MKNPEQEKLNFAKNEVELSKILLQNNPDDEVQKNRLAYWLLILGELDGAKEFGTSEKMLGLIAAYERHNSV